MILIDKQSEARREKRKLKEERYKKGRDRKNIQLPMLKHRSTQSFHPLSQQGGDKMDQSSCQSPIQNILSSSFLAGCDDTVSEE